MDTFSVLRQAPSDETDRSAALLLKNRENMNMSAESSRFSNHPENHQHESSQKRNGQVPIMKPLRCILGANCSRNHFEMSNLHRRCISWHALCINVRANQTNIMNNQFESTYALLVRLDDKGRGVLETLVYAVLISGVVLSIWQFAQSPVKIPAAGIERCVVCGPTVPRAASQS